MNSPSLASLVVVLALSGAAMGKAALDQGVRFNTAGVLDLAEATQPATSGKAVAVAALPAADAAQIAAKKTQNEEQPAWKLSDDEFGCKPASKKCSQEHEGALLLAQVAVAKRTAKELVITATAGTPARFVDWKQTPKGGDGDGETHLYLGTLSGSGYHRVEVQFGHDSPGNFLVNAKNGKVAFVHTGSDVVVPSPDGARLITFNALNGPIGIRVAALDATGPRVTLHCHGRDGRAAPTAAFKGWHDPSSFDLVVGTPGAGAALDKPVSVRASADKSGWHLAASDGAQLSAHGFQCRAE